MICGKTSWFSIITGALGSEVSNGSPSLYHEISSPRLHGVPQSNERGLPSLAVIVTGLRSIIDIGTKI